jgi:hypothetical protein
MPSCGVIVYLHAQQTPELVAAAAWRCNRATLLPRTCLFQVREQTGTHTSRSQSETVAATEAHLCQPLRVGQDLPAYSPCVCAFSSLA